MHKVYLFVLFSIASISFALAQGSPVMTLDECVRYALQNEINVKNALIDEQISVARVKETVGLGLPQIDGSVALQHNSKLSRFFSRYSVAQGFNPDLNLPGVEPDDILGSQNFFQLKSAGNANIAVNQLIFNSSYLVGLQAANTYKELATRNTKATEIEVVSKVIKAYYSVLINNERVGLFDANIARVDSLMRSTNALYANGFVEAIDVDRTKVTLNNLKTERANFIKLRDLSLNLLKFQMGFPLEQEIKIAGQLSDLGADTFNATIAEEVDPGNRIEYQVLQTQRRLQELDIKNKFSGSLPSLVGFANLGYTTQSANIAGLFKTETNAKDDGFVGPDKWYPAVNFGISLNIPLFSGLQRTYKLQQARLTLTKIDNSAISLKQGIVLEASQSQIAYANAIETLASQKENVELAERVARVTKIKYEQGVGSNIEVTEAESALRQAQVNYYSSIYDAVISKIDLDKAHGKIDPLTFLSETKK